MTKRRFIIFQIALVIICTVSLVVTTFSWAQPASNGVLGGNQMVWKDSFTIRDESCSLKTYMGVKNNQGAVYYSNDEIDFSLGYQVDLYNKEPDMYFKTEIKNTGEATNISLYLQDATVTNQNGILYLGVDMPLNTYEELANEDALIAPDIYIENGGTAVIYWYIQGDNLGASTTKVNLKNMYVVYS